MIIINCFIRATNLWRIRGETITRNIKSIVFIIMDIKNISDNIALDSGLCTGSIIHEKYIITAKHCVVPAPGQE